jgi:hypothetical protein
LEVIKFTMNLKCMEATSAIFIIRSFLGRSNVASQGRRRKDSVILTKVVLEVTALSVCTYLQASPSSTEVGQARAVIGLIPACSMTPSWDFSKMSLAFHRSSARRGNGDIPCSYIQGPKDKGEKAARYKQQEWSEKVLL